MPPTFRGVAPTDSSLYALLLCFLADDHHSEFQVSGMAQSCGGVSVCDALQCLSVYGQNLISLLDGSFLSRQPTGKHLVDLGCQRGFDRKDSVIDKE